ncbi:MAG: PHB depolymerase family esterase [Myxococcota bacterium]
MRTLVLLPLMTSGCATGTDAPTGDNGLDENDPRRDASTWATEVGPEDRRVAVTRPSSYDGSSKLPLVVVLHGYGASGAVQNRFFRMGSRAAEQNMIVLAPDGTTDTNGKQFWNATDACCDFGNTNVDDVGYLLGLINEVEETIPIDPDRIVVIGHSNGGFMSYRLACEAPDRIAAIASLAGANFVTPTDCKATESVSVLQIHGTQDTTIQYGGGDGFGGFADYPGAEASAGHFAALAGCDRKEETGLHDYETVVGGAETRREAWTGCDSESVELWTIEGGSHIPILTDAFHDDALSWLLDQRR